jgi:hydrogenase maturation protease
LLSKKIGIIGLGNTLRRDDGIGILVIESLLEFYRRQDIDYLNFGSASFDLLNRIKTYDKVLLIDGINAGLGSGELKISKLKDIRYRLDRLVGSTHALNLKTIFRLSQMLKLKTEIYVAGIQIQNTSYGEGLSQPLEDKKEGIIKEIAKFIDKRFQPGFSQYPGFGLAPYI